MLADAVRGLAEPAQRPEEASVLLVDPAHVAAPPPTVRAQPIEPAVIADAEARVRLGVVTGQHAELRPGVEVSGPARGDETNGVSA